MHFHHLLSFLFFRVSLISWDFGSKRAYCRLYTCAQCRRREGMCTSILKILLTEKHLNLNVYGNVLEDHCLEEFQLLFFSLIAPHKFYSSKSAPAMYPEMSNFSYINFFSRLPDATQWNKWNFRNSEQSQNHNLPTYADISWALRIMTDKMATSINQEPFNPGTCFISSCWKNQQYSLPCSFRLPYSSK